MRRLSKKIQTKIYKRKFIPALVVAALFAVVGIYILGVSRAYTGDYVQVVVTGYSGNVTVNVSSPMPWPCANGTGTFQAPALCSFGYTSGYTQGASVQVTSPPSGYHVTTWSIVDNSEHQNASCSSTGCSFNFPGGAIAVGVTLAPNQPPSLSAGGASQTSVPLSWSATAGANRYNVYRDGHLAAQLGTGTTSYTTGGLSCGASHSFFVQAAFPNSPNLSSNTVTSHTTACSKSSSPSHTTSPSPGSTSVNLPANNAIIPPSAPTNFKAQTQKSTPTVHLSWTASSPGSSIVLNYQIDRSVDQQIWEALPVGTSTSQYDDKGAAFGTHYYYRIRAIDSSSQTSSYATTDVTTSSFTKNVSSGSSTVISLASAGLQVTIPAGAVDGSVQCGLDLAYGLTLPSIPNLNIFGGPYQLTCKTSAGTVVTTFKKPLVLTSTISKSALQHVSNIAYYGYATNNKLQSLVVTSHNADTGIYQVQLGNTTAFVLMSAPKHSPSWLRTFFIIFGLFIVIIAILFVISQISRWRARKKAMQLEASYHEKEIGGF